jgi:recombination protein RecR
MADDSGNLPEPLRELVKQLAGLPGLGPKSALRMAMVMLKWPETRARDLGRAIFELRDKLCLCSRCNSLADTNPCRLCEDPGRNQETLCVLAEWDSLLAMEEGGFYRGGYFILGGLLAPLDGVDSDGLELGKLRERLRQGQIKELILGLGTTIEAENTASYLRNMTLREFPNLRVTRLAQGIPLGAEVRYIDKETLRQSLAYRQEL